MKTCIAVFLSLISSSAAFAPISTSKPSTALNVELDNLAGSTAPLQKWDPLGLSTVGDEETFRWFQAAELKHGRVAMLATTGYIVQGSGFHFGGQLSDDTTFES